MEGGSGLDNVDAIIRCKKLLLVLLLIHRSGIQGPGTMKLLNSPRSLVPWGCLRFWSASPHALSCDHVLVHLTHSGWSLFPSASPVGVCCVTNSILTWWMYLYCAFILERYGHLDWQLFSISTWKILITVPCGLCSYCWEITHQSGCYVSVVICLSALPQIHRSDFHFCWLELSGLPVVRIATLQPFRRAFNNCHSLLDIVLTLYFLLLEL